eukprot:2934882-Karenia_brevis.AAC.1
MEAGMEFSPTKNVVAASCTRVAQAVETRLVKLKVKKKRVVTSLGAPLGAGRVRNVQVAKKRQFAFQARRGRFALLKRAGRSVTRVLKTGGVHALTYGQENMGVSSSCLMGQRRAVAGHIQICGAGDLDLTLALADGRGKAKLDPAFHAHWAPMLAWAEAV